MYNLAVLLGGQGNLASEEVRPHGT